MIVHLSLLRSSEKYYQQNLLQIKFHSIINPSDKMNQEAQFSEIKIIDCIAIIDIDPTLTHFKPTQQKWISSLQLYADLPKDVKSGSKVLNLLFGLYLVINYCEKNRLPIYEIDFISQPGPEWVTVKMPHTLADRFTEHFLCYKTEQIQLTEPLGDIEVINTQRKSLFGHDKQVLNVPNGYKVVSNPIFQSFLIYKRMRSRLQQKFKPIIVESYPQGHKTSLDLIPSFCFPEGIKLSRQLKGFITFSFILTQSSGDRLYITYLAFKELLYEHLKNKLNVKGIQNIYYDKAFCLISKYKFSDQFSDCLQHLYRLSMSKNDQPFYKVAQNFVNQLKMPKQISTHGFSYSYSGCNIIFEYDPILQTVSDKSIYCVFKFMPVEQILTVFKAILYERQVIFVSQSKTVLGLVMEAFTSLLFPFKWENVIIPIVPLTMKQYLTAPIPFLAGVTTAQLIDLSIESEVIIVLLDSGKVMNDEDLPPLPEKLHKQLLKRLQQFQIYDPQQVKEYLENPQNTYMFKMMEVENPEFKGMIIREAFFQFFITLMKNYKKFWKNKFLKDIRDTFSNKQNESQLISQIFKLQDFMSDLGINKVGSFGHKFTEGAIFTAFLERRHFDGSDLIANFFDDCLQKKKNKKFEGPLLVKAQKSRYIVSKHPQPEKEKRLYSYERFPSILGETSSKQLLKQEIQLQIEEQLICENDFLEFIEQQRYLNNGFFQLGKIEEYKTESDIPLLNLLTKKNKEAYILQLRLDQKEGKKYFETFKEIYHSQNQSIRKIFEEWPNFSKNQFDHVRLDKMSYFSTKLEKKISGQSAQKLYSIWQGSNLQIIIKGSIKIILVSSHNELNDTYHSQIKNTALSSSTICRSVQSVYVQIPSFRIKTFLNKIFETQAGEIFQFIYNKVKNGSDNRWNIETILELKKHIERQYQEDQVREDKFATDKTLSIECQNINFEVEQK